MVGGGLMQLVAYGNGLTKGQLGPFLRKCDLKIKMLPPKRKYNNFEIILDNPNTFNKYLNITHKTVNLSNRNDFKFYFLFKLDENELITYLECINKMPIEKYQKKLHTIN